MSRLVWRGTVPPLQAPQTTRMRAIAHDRSIPQSCRTAGRFGSQIRGVSPPRNTCYLVLLFCLATRRWMNLEPSFL